MPLSSVVETSPDSLDPAEQAQVSWAAATDFYAYDLELRRNAEGMIWAVLTPREETAGLPQFTFCRIEPSIIVQLTDRAGRRQFRSLSSIGEALAFAREAWTQAACAEHPDQTLH